MRISRARSSRATWSIGGDGTKAPRRTRAVRFEAEFRNQPLGEFCSLPRAGVSFLMAAGPFRTGDDVNLVRPRFKRPQQMQALDSSRARQGEEANPGAELFFRENAGLDPGRHRAAGKRKSVAQTVFFDVHGNLPSQKKTGTSLETSPSIFRHTIVRMIILYHGCRTVSRKDFYRFQLFR